MNRRNFFTKCAAFVAGCAIGIKSIKEPINVVSVGGWNPKDYSGTWEFYSVVEDEPVAISLAGSEMDWKTVSASLTPCLES